MEVCLLVFPTKFSLEFDNRLKKHYAFFTFKAEEEIFKVDFFVPQGDCDGQRQPRLLVGYQESQTASSATQLQRSRVARWQDGTICSHQRWIVCQFIRSGFNFFLIPSTARKK